MSLLRKWKPIKNCGKFGWVETEINVMGKLVNERFWNVYYIFLTVWELRVVFGLLEVEGQ
jgi:hypothetical protein